MSLGLDLELGAPHPSRPSSLPPPICCESVHFIPGASAASLE